MNIMLVIKALFQKIYRTFLRRYPIYHLAEVNLATQEVVFRVKNRAIYVRCSFFEAVSNLSIIENLPPVEASWLGGYVGRALRTSEKKNKALKKMSFLLKNEQGQYRIVFQNRAGEVGYYDKKTKKEFIEDPMSIVNNKYVISRFDPSQACYIGILAGLKMGKILSSGKEGELELLREQRPRLRIVD